MGTFINVDINKKLTANIDNYIEVDTIYLNPEEKKKCVWNGINIWLFEKFKDQEKPIIKIYETIEAKDYLIKQYNEKVKYGNSRKVKLDASEILPYVSWFIYGLDKKMKDGKQSEEAIYNELKIYFGMIDECIANADVASEGKYIRNYLHNVNTFIYLTKEQSGLKTDLLTDYILKTLMTISKKRFVDDDGHKIDPMRDLKEKVAEYLNPEQNQSFNNYLKALNQKNM